MSKKERLGMGWGVLVGALYVVLNGVYRTLYSICMFYEGAPRAYDYLDYFVHSLQYIPKIAFSLLTLVSIIAAIIYSFQGKCKKVKWSLLICIASLMCYVLFQILGSLLMGDSLYFGIVFLFNILMLGVVMVMLFLFPKLKGKGQRIACGVGIVLFGLFFMDAVLFDEGASIEMIAEWTIDFVLGSLPYLFFAIFVSDSLLKSESRNCNPKVGARETVVAKFCSLCGNPLSAGALFCASCGARCMRNMKPKKNCFLLSTIACGLNAIIICILPLFCERDYDLGGHKSIAWFFHGAGCLHYRFDDAYVVFGILLLFFLGSIMGIYFTREWLGMMTAAGVYLFLYFVFSGLMWCSSPLSTKHMHWTMGTGVHIAALCILFLAIYLDHLRTLRIAKTNQMVRKSYCISVVDILTMVFMGVLLVLAVIGWCVGTGWCVG